MTESPDDSARQSAQTKPFRVLVVDDDAFMGQLIARLLARLGVPDTIVAASGREALQCIDNGNQFELALLDLFMPDMDGIELIEQLADRRLPMSLTLLSGHDIRYLQQARALAEKRGLHVAGILQKPVTAATLEALLQQMSA
jgi:CheY-like chemotaxis protein